MSSHLELLSSERARAKTFLDASPQWIAWKTAHALLLLSPAGLDEQGAWSSPPVSVAPEQLLDVTDSLEALDEQDPVLQAYASMRHVDNLRQQLIDSAEWRAFQQAQHHLHVFVREELRGKRRAMMERRGVVDDGRGADASYTRRQSSEQPQLTSSSSPVQITNTPCSTLSSTSMPSQRASATEQRIPVVVADSLAAAGSRDMMSSTDETSPPGNAFPHTMASSFAPFGSSSSSSPLVSATCALPSTWSTNHIIEVDEYPTFLAAPSAAPITWSAESHHTRCDTDCDYNFGDYGELVPLDHVADTTDAPDEVQRRDHNPHLSVGDSHIESANEARNGTKTNVFVPATSQHQHQHQNHRDAAAIDQLQQNDDGDRGSRRKSSKRRSHSPSDSRYERDRSKRSTSDTPSSIDRRRHTTATSSTEAWRRCVWVQSREFVRKDDLFRLFSRFGRVERVDVPSQRSGCLPFAFVHFVDERDAWHTIGKGQDGSLGSLTVKPCRRPRSFETR